MARLKDSIRTKVLAGSLVTAALCGCTMGFSKPQETADLLASEAPSAIDPGTSDPVPAPSQNDTQPSDPPAPSEPRPPEVPPPSEPSPAPPADPTPAATPSQPASMSDGTRWLDKTASPILRWTASTSSAGISTYQVAIGTTAGGTNISNWVNVGNVTSRYITNLTLVNGTTYYASVRAVDVNGKAGPARSGNGWVVGCPANYVRISKNTTYVNADFCLSKFEMKYVAGAAAAQAGGTPFSKVSRNEAISACTGLGTGFDLISNNEWQTMARDLENTGWNWSGGAVGSGAMSRGHSDGAPNNVIADSSSDSNSCINTGQSCSLTTWNDQRRVFKLSTGEYLWDVAGNLWEWLKDDEFTSRGAEMRIASITDPTLKRLWGPAGDYTSSTVAPWAGLGQTWWNQAAGTMIRGGGYENWDHGVFSISTDISATTAQSNAGFRCVFHPY